MALVFPWIGRARQIALTQAWARGLLAIFGVRLRHEGSLPARRGALLVANHIGWLDVAVLMAVQPTRFVAKAEIRRWPVLGWLAEKAGTLFIERRLRRDAGRINRQMGEILAAGECVAFFPEGTTSAGDCLRPFNPALLQPAVDSGAPLWPVAIRYPQAGGGSNHAVAYIDHMSFTGSVWRILGEPEVRAELIFAAPIPTVGQTRRQLAHAAESAIAAALCLEVRRTPPEKAAGLPGAGR